MNLNKVFFLLKAADKTHEMTETEWKEWMMENGINAGFTVEEILAAISKKNP